MVQRIIVVLREGCPWCSKTNRRLHAIGAAAAAVGAEMEVAAHNRLPEEMTGAIRGFPAFLFTDLDGNVLLNKTLYGFMFTDDLEGAEKFMRVVVRWLLAVRTNDV